MLTYYIYELYNEVSRRRYIGLTSDPQRREKEHFINLRNHKHTAENIIDDYIKYGENSFSFRVIDNAKTKEEGLRKEKRYIIRLNTYVPEYGYNGNDSRFRKSNPLPKCKNSEFLRRIKTQGYRLYDIPWRIGMDYVAFINKLNEPETFTKEEMKKLNDYISLSRWERWQIYLKSYYQEQKEVTHGK